MGFGVTIAVIVGKVFTVTDEVTNDPLVQPLLSVTETVYAPAPAVVIEGIDAVCVDAAKVLGPLQL